MVETRYAQMYEGYLEPWQVGVVMRCMLEQEVPEHEWDEVIQDVAPKIREAADGKDSGGISPATRIFRLVKGRIRAGRRRSQTYRRHVQEVPRQQEWADLENQVAVPDETAHFQVTHDVRHTMDELSEQHQLLCRFWASGMSRQEIADAMRLGWHTVERMQDEIRRHFARAGLDN